MILAYKKTLGKFTKVLGFEKTPPPLWEKFPKNPVFFLGGVPKLRKLFLIPPHPKSPATNIQKYHQILKDVQISGYILMSIYPNIQA